MSRDRGARLQNALAEYLRQWWEKAESAGSGRPGTDVVGTPGIVWENKTGSEFRPWGWVRQAMRHVKNGELPVCVYWPGQVGKQRPEMALAILPLGEFMRLAEDAGWTPIDSLAPEVRRES